VRILLPPSEAKTAGGQGTPLRRRTRKTALDAPRRQVVAALEELLATHDAAAALLIPPSASDAALAHNAAVLDGPTLPALARYSGVLYDGLAATLVDERAKRLAREAVLIFSGLFGVVRGGEAVPNYRVPAKAALPGVGIAGTFWRASLTTVVPSMLDRGVVIDLRSSDYAAMWQPDRKDPLAERVVTVRILSPRPDGRLGVISFPSKFHKGRLAGLLLESAAAGREPTAPEHLIDTWTGAGGKDGQVLAGRPGPVVELIAHTSTVL
jgi:hypothetical protein